MNSSVEDKRRVRLGNGLIRFSGTILLISSVVKFLHPAKAVAYMRFFGYMENTLFPIAAMELAIALMFLRRAISLVGHDYQCSGMTSGVASAAMPSSMRNMSARDCRLFWNNLY